jgi:hypothetical protein
MKIYLTLTVLFFTSFGFCQSPWTSSKHKYSIEIPNGFTISESIGSNVDFKANRNKEAIVIVVKTIPPEYINNTIWDIIGDLNTFGTEWQLGANEYFNNPKFIKCGKTKVGNQSAFWYDFSTENSSMYLKNYQFKKGNKLYTITLSCNYSEINQYAPVWFRFKENFFIK